jgi:hypothetical protein
MIDRQVVQLVRLVDDLLDVSRITRGRIELRREAIELTAVVARAVEVVRPLSDAMGHELTINMPPQPIYLYADDIRLTQIIGNLLTNASKFTNEGGHIEQIVNESHQLNHLAIDHVDSGVSGRSRSHCLPPLEVQRVTNRGQRVAQLVRQHREEFVLAAIRLDQVGGQTLQRVRRLLLLGDIRDAKQNPVGFAVGAAQLASIEEHRAATDGREIVRHLEVVEDGFLRQDVVQQPAQVGNTPLPLPKFLDHTTASIAR